jgi:cysteine-rich repeat protein
MEIKLDAKLAVFPILAYTCTGAIGAASVCAVTCGDGVKGGSEQCDNGNKIGCQTGCKFDAGYSCSGAFGQPSVCFSNICGDSILGNG